MHYELCVHIVMMKMCNDKITFYTTLQFFIHICFLFLLIMHTSELMKQIVRIINYLYVIYVYFTLKQLRLIEN